MDTPKTPPADATDIPELDLPNEAAPATAPAPAPAPKSTSVSILPPPVATYYSGVSSTDVAWAEGEGKAIVILGRQGSAAIIAQGRKLYAVKKRLGHGRFSPWCKAVCSMSQRTAERMMQIAKDYGNGKIDYNNLPPPSILYALIALPEPERAEIVADMKAGADAATVTKNVQVSAATKRAEARRKALKEDLARSKALRKAAEAEAKAANENDAKATKITAPDGSPLVEPTPEATKRIMAAHDKSKATDDSLVTPAPKIEAQANDNIEAQVVGEIEAREAREKAADMIAETFGDRLSDLLSVLGDQKIRASDLEAARDRKRSVPLAA